MFGIAASGPFFGMMGWQTIIYSDMMFRMTNSNKFEPDAPKIPNKFEPDAPKIRDLLAELEESFAAAKRLRNKRLKKNS